MIAVDTNILVDANREESALHAAALLAVLLTEDRDLARFRSFKSLSLQMFLHR